MKVKTLMLAAALILAAPAVKAETRETGEGGEDLEKTIEHLLDYVRTSDVVFIRNRKEHAPGEAADHIARKYRHYRDDIETPEDFIRLSATKSMLSGRRYRVRLPGGEEIDTADWLLEELRRYRGRGKAPADTTGHGKECANDSSRA